jgi:glyoxylase I family protein
VVKRKYLFDKNCVNFSWWALPTLRDSILLVRAGGLCITSGGFNRCSVLTILFIMIKILSCLHVAVMVSNLARSIEFYTHILGLTQVDRDLNYPGIWYQIGDVQIHLIEDINYQSNSDIDLTKSTRNPHIALGIGDLTAAKEQLLAANCVVKMSNSGRAALFTQDPDGNIIELTLISAE